jgi:hypothetical protein
VSLAKSEEELADKFEQLLAGAQVDSHEAKQLATSIEATISDVMIGCHVVARTCDLLGGIPRVLFFLPIRKLRKNNHRIASATDRLMQIIKPATDIDERELAHDAELLDQLVKQKSEWVDGNSYFAERYSRTNSK